MAIERIMHVGICVRDLPLSHRFYRDVLGFRELSKLQIADAPTAKLLEMSELDLRAVYLERDGLRLELLGYPTPGVVGRADPRPMNQLGLTHLAVRVSDLDAVLERVKAGGGRVLEHTRIANPAFQSQVVFVTDPDGTRLELVEAPGDPAAPLGELIG
jgi:catechol 2,3-dioxygenase-like lactoylglutathione lyase family enzyme